MIQVGCRLWNLSLASVLFLTCSNILLTVRLLNSSDCSQHQQEQQHNADEFRFKLLEDADHRGEDGLDQAVEQSVQDEEQVSGPEVEPDTITVDMSLGRWDSRRLLKMFDHSLVGARFAKLSAEWKVTLATQSSLERLFWLVQVAHHWQGPMSVALYAAGDEWLLVQGYVRFLRRCYAPIRERVSFHVAFPRDRMPAPQVDSDAVGELLAAEGRLNCLKPEPSLKELLRMRRPETARWRQHHGYPQNHLRNLARKACQTEYVFLTDVDVVPSPDLSQGVDEFLQTAHCGPGASEVPKPPPRLPRVSAGVPPPVAPQCAYVIPTYEVDERVRFPKIKSDLVRLANKGLARPFHQKVFIFNQYATNFSRWQSEAEVDDQKVHVAYNVTNFEFLYEPFYIARDTVPQHDERFMGYGYTRNTQVYEMFVAGYEFQVLSPVFTVHWKLQSKKDRPAWREIQNTENRRHFDVFKQEVIARYRRDPLSKRKPAGRT